MSNTRTVVEEKPEAVVIKDTDVKIIKITDCETEKVIKEIKDIKIIKTTGEKIIKVTAGIPQQLVLDTIIGCYFLI